ncbi:LEAF RUST 10 DISEASE-RESISTANCE LOCUS RECEPTOR-LIKE PROTEIN KINASE-like 1.1 [Nymphaea colorata]|nr:LEAF RUST 10 DISEASE-RESISTANCE LOCUS RECEPTOR-LIKE PROTEIN KINASE-like 1.1 [Nymphaea colorata]
MAAACSILCFSPRLLPLLILSLHLCCVLSDERHPREDCSKDFFIRCPFNHDDGPPPNCGIHVISCSEGTTYISLFDQKFTVNISYCEGRIDIDLNPMSFVGLICGTPKFEDLADKLLRSGFCFSTPSILGKCNDTLRKPETLKKVVCATEHRFIVGCKGQQIPAPNGQCHPDLPSETFSLHWEPECDSGGNNLPACHCKNGSAIPSDPTTKPISNGGPTVSYRGKKTNHFCLAVIIGVVSSSVIFVTCFLLFLCFRNRNCRRQSHVVASVYTCSSSSRTSNQPNLESTSFYRRCRNVTIFSYEELEKATEGFSPSNELGDGGFGIVYYGVLSDGRKVAVKRLFEHSFNRVEQFLNEIEILSKIQHTNLVQLYGCTTRNSRELLLVYEYVDNGTVDDHLYGSRAADGCLTWKLRLNIAVKTAEALAYLHQLKPPIIHRDVKTSNILLDKNFHVKVSDFGLSRLFPCDVSHVSTIPQGTPGYIDPQYHQCYQLTDKSDVYSFGVVLVELISSLPAVDIMRPNDEVNLANMATNMIRNNALHEFVDSTLGFQSDYLVQKSVGSVAELAFSCLAYDMEVRPTMNEVAETLRQIQAQVQKSEKNKPAFQALLKSTVFLKARGHSSPNPVDDKQVKQPTIPNSIV